MIIVIVIVIVLCGGIQIVMHTYICMDKGVGSLNVQRLSITLGEIHRLISRRVVGSNPTPRSFLLGSIRYSGRAAVKAFN